MPRPADAQSASAGLAAEPACSSFTPAAAGGALPRGRDVLVLRWLGIANYEIAYRGTVLLLDAAYSRVPPARPVGFGPADARKVSAMFIGHPHGDHMWDAVEVAKRTGAPVYGARQLIDYLRAEGVPEEQTRLARGPVTFDGVTVEPIAFRHSLPRPPAVQKAMEAYAQAVREIIRPRTPDEDKQQRAINARRAPGGDVDANTLAYLFTFDNGFRMIYTDTAGPPTPELEAAMRRVGTTDVALVAYQGRFLPARQNEDSLPLVRLFKPRYVLPTHHDDDSGARPDMPIYPLAMAIKEELPDTQTLVPLYRSPICFNTTTGDVLAAR